MKNKKEFLYYMGDLLYSFILKRPSNQNQGGKEKKIRKAATYYVCN
jgi:hypothetical protein